MRLAFVILFASWLVAMAAPAPLQHNPFTITTNAPNVTVPVTQPVSITTTSRVSVEFPSLAVTTNTIQGAVNMASAAYKTGLVLDPTGLLDSTAAIQAALNLATETVTGMGSFKLHLPAGYYIVTNTLTMDKGPIWFGDGRATTIDYRGSGPCINIVNGPANSGCGLSDLTILCHLTNSGVSIVATANNPVLSNVRIDDSLDGISIGGATETGKPVVEKCQINNPRRFGLFANKCDSLTVIGSLFEGDTLGNSAVGIMLTNCVAPQIIGCEVQYFGTNVAFRGTTRAPLIHGVYMENLTNNTIHVAVLDSTKSARIESAWMQCSNEGGQGTCIILDTNTVDVTIESCNEFGATTNFVRNLTTGGEVILSGNTLDVTEIDNYRGVNGPTGSRFRLWDSVIANSGAVFNNGQVAGQYFQVKTTNSADGLTINLDTGNASLGTPPASDTRLLLKGDTSDGAHFIQVWKSADDVNRYVFPNVGEALFYGGLTLGQDLIVNSQQGDFKLRVMSAGLTNLIATSPTANTVGFGVEAASDTLVTVKGATQDNTKYTMLGKDSGGSVLFSFRNDGQDYLVGPIRINNLLASAALITDGGTNLVSVANQASSVYLNNGSQPYWFAGKTTNINVLCDGNVTNQFQFVSGVLSNIVSVP